MEKTIREVREMDTVERGEMLKSTLTGKVYQVKVLTDQMVVLQSLDGLTQVMTGKLSLDYFYERLSPQSVMNSPEPI
jgi:hypothetical protein